MAEDRVTVSREALGALREAYVMPPDPDGIEDISAMYRATDALLATVAPLPADDGADHDHHQMLVHIVNEWGALGTVRHILGMFLPEQRRELLAALDGEPADAPSPEPNNDKETP